MNYLSYKTFVWPQNPHTYKEELVREPKYYTQDGVVYFDKMGDLKRTISGSGVFYGENAYDSYKRLMNLFGDPTPGNLQHPVWGIFYCYFTGLEMTQEPEENRISYSFTFTGALANGIVPD